MHFIIVRRGQDEKFRFLKETFERYPIDVFWDRRAKDRRQRVEVRPVDHRRGGDRRRAVPETWAELDFVLAPQALAHDAR
jgi:hypothetical protein